MIQKCIFIDSDVLIDVFAKRQPFYIHSAKCLELAEAGKYHAYTSPLIIANVFYVIHKFSDKITARDCIKKIRQYINCKY
jgi:predicted nucleic acid-binding protein